MKKPITIVILTIGIYVFCYLLGLNVKQQISTTIFFLFIISTLLFWRFRLSFAFMGIFALLFTGVLDVQNLLKFANLDIILFLVGMMTAIGFLEKRNFFEFLMMSLLHRIGMNARILMAVMMLMAGFFGALIDEVTSILFMTAIMLQLVDKFKLRPVPFILMMVFATNVGSSATVIGNPVGVLIAFRGGLTFMDFLRWATPVTLIVLFVLVIICLIIFKDDIRYLQKCLDKENSLNGKPEVHPKHVLLSSIFISITLPLLIFHSVIEKLLHLEKNTMLLGAAFISAGMALFIDRKDAKNLFKQRVDWWTLCFFALFFASVGTLKYVGTIDILGEWMIKISGGSTSPLFFIFSSATAILTPVMDNVLVVAVFIPIVNQITTLGMQSYPIWWGILFSGTLFGNLTMIGSTANIVAIGMLEEKGYEVTLQQWIKPGIIVSVITLAIAILLIYIQIPLMPLK